MKKILFLAKIPTCLNENLLTKLYGEINAHTNLGFEVWYIEWNGKEFELVCNNDKRRIFLKKRTCGNQQMYYHTLYFIDLYKIAIKLIVKGKFDAIYMRLMPFFKSTVRLGNEAKKRNTDFIIEIPSYPFKKEASESKSVKQKLKVLLENIYAKNIWKNVDLIVLCADGKYDTAMGRPAVNICNGIDVSMLNTRQKVDSRDINILALASMSYWQGFDRLIVSLSKYEGSKNVFIHFVGNDGDGSLQSWKKLADDLNVKDRIVFHGPLYDEKLDDIFNKMDVGVGPLALYKRDCYTSTALKIREYMARGLPFVYACDDEAIEYNTRYMYKVSNDASEIDFQGIVEFADNVKKDGDVMQMMRQYAIDNLSWERQMKIVYEHLNKVKEG